MQPRLQEVTVHQDHMDGHTMGLILLGNADVADKIEVTNSDSDDDSVAIVAADLGFLAGSFLPCAVQCFVAGQDLAKNKPCTWNLHIRRIHVCMMCLGVWFLLPHGH